MIGIIYLLVKISYIYITSPYIAKALKVPVIFPLIPYLPQIFSINFLPPFYFTYWIIIIALIAVPHEFAHGIFAKLNKVRIKSTGFGFLGPFLAAFVEQDEKQMQKTSKFAQLSILAAGTFANILVMIVFALIFWVFFALAFTPAGVTFDGYANSAINVHDISSINGIPTNNCNVNAISNNLTYVRFTSENLTYYTTPRDLKQTFSSNLSLIEGFDDSPAFDANLTGAISEFNGNSIRSYQQLKSAILSQKPGDLVNITTITGSGLSNYQIKLGNLSGNAFLGIGELPVQNSGMFGWIYTLLDDVKSPYVYYQSSSW